MKTQIVTSAALSVLGIIAVVTVYGYSRSANPAPATDEITAEITRFEAVRHALPLNSKLGYMTDLANPNKGDNSDLPYLARYLKVTYAMAPILVDPKLNQPGQLILADFRLDPQRGIKALADSYDIQRDFGGGILLVEKKR